MSFVAFPPSPAPPLRAPLGSAQTSFHFPVLAPAARYFPLSHSFLVCPMGTHIRLPPRVVGVEWGQPGGLVFVSASCRPWFCNYLAESASVLSGAQEVNCPVCRQTYHEVGASHLPSLSLASTRAKRDNTNSTHLGMRHLPQVSELSSWPAVLPKYTRSHNMY